MNEKIWVWKNLLSSKRKKLDSEVSRSELFNKMYSFYFENEFDNSRIVEEPNQGLKRKKVNETIKDQSAIQQFVPEKKQPFSIFDDHNRIVSSSAFRRLQNKTQVYPLEKHDYVRTRLTHSIEVASISEDILREIKKSDLIDQTFNENFDAIQCCAKNSALLHDIGNPPFGHYGEDAIRNFFIANWDKMKYYEEETLAIFEGQSIDTSDGNNIVSGKLFCDVINKDRQEYYDFVRFDGNAQALRIINSTQPYVGNNGLNLTFATMASIIKYPNNSLNSNPKHPKFGYYLSEKDTVVQLSKEGCYIEGKTNPIALIMEAADDISNLINDFIDAIKKKKITLSDILYIKDTYKNDPFISSLDCGSKEKDLLMIVSEKTEVLKHIFIKAVANEFVDNYTTIMNGEYKGNFIDNIFKQETGRNIEYQKNVEDEPIEIKVKELSSKNIVQILREMFKLYVYNDCDIVSLELQGERIISFLIEHFLKAVLELNIGYNWKESAKTKNQKILQLLSTDYVMIYLKSIESNRKPENILYSKIHLVVDHICGMTDEYAKESYKIIMGII